MPGPGDTQAGGRVCQAEETALQKHRNVRQVSVEAPESHLPYPYPPHPYVPMSHQVSSLAVPWLHSLLCRPTGSTRGHPCLQVSQLAVFPTTLPLLWFVFFALTNEVLEYQADDEMALPPPWPPPTSACTADGSYAEKPMVCMHTGLVRVSASALRALPLEGYLSSWSMWKSFPSFPQTQFKDHCFTKLSLTAAATPPRSLPPPVAHCILDLAPGFQWLALPMARKPYPWRPRSPECL